MRGLTYAQACDAVAERLQHGDTVTFVSGKRRLTQSDEAFRAEWSTLRRDGDDLIELEKWVRRADQHVARCELEELEQLGYARREGGFYRILSAVIERDRELSWMTPRQYVDWRVRADNAARR